MNSTMTEILNRIAEFLAYLGKIDDAHLLWDIMNLLDERRINKFEELVEYLSKLGIVQGVRLLKVCDAMAEDVTEEIAKTVVTHDPNTKIDYDFHKTKWLEYFCDALAVEPEMKPVTKEELTKIATKLQYKDVDTALQLLYNLIDRLKRDRK